MTVGVITDTVLDNEVLDELDKYRVVAYINTPSKATKVYCKCRRRREGSLLIKVEELKAFYNFEWFIENIALSVGRLLASNEKESIHVWIHNKCIVY